MGEHEDSTVTTLHDLLTGLQPRATDQDLAQVRHAYAVAEGAHIGQRRKSGEPYIIHPLAVAGILAGIHMDANTIAAALLHDVVEDTAITLETLRGEFGDEVALMVDGVTKLNQRDAAQKSLAGESPDAAASETFAYRTDREAESLRKMLLSVVKDVRVVLIKLADRLHNMRTLGAMPAEKQKRIARETLDIYAPLANRLGIWEWKHELEELGLRYADPEQYDYLSRMLALGELERQAAIQAYIEQVRAALAEYGIVNIEITGRAKQIYSLWRKMQRKNSPFDRIRDTQAIRVIIEDAPGAEAPSDALEPAEPDSPEATERRALKLAARKRLMADPGVQSCYAALGIVHRLWPPIPGEFDDYIGVPKDNHYQSLHTAVQTETGTLEVQIRTRSMHRSAEFGVAAHWLYKDSTRLSVDYLNQMEALRSAIKSIGSETDNAAQFVDALKTDQLKEQVFAFTPKGKVIELPKGGTVLDFAYRIHSDIGDRCRGGRVNNMMQPLGYHVQNNDVIEILTRKEPMPSRDWLTSDDFCTTSNARNKIRAFFRKQDREQNISAGREVVEREIKRMGVAGWMKTEDIFRLFKVPQGDEDEFLERVGFGQISSNSLTSHIMGEDRRREQERQERLAGLGAPFGGLADLFRLRLPQPGRHHGHGAAKKGQFIVQGVPGLQVDIAQCCKPVPGDGVVGYVTRGQGIRVHNRECRNILNAEQERLIEVVYEGDSHEVFNVQFVVNAAERPGLLGELATALGEHKINIVECTIAKRSLQQGDVTIWLKAEVTDVDEITTAMKLLKNVRNVFEVQRVTNGRRGVGGR